jgi:hypothetical protein
VSGLPNAATVPVVCPCCPDACTDPHMTSLYSVRSGWSVALCSVHHSCLAEFRDRALKTIEETRQKAQADHEAYKAELRATVAARLIRLLVSTRWVAELLTDRILAILHCDSNNAEAWQRELHSGHTLLSEYSIHRPADVKKGWMWCIKRPKGCMYTTPLHSWCKEHEKMDACWSAVTTAEAEADGGWKRTGA